MTVATASRVCAVQGCEREYRAKGYCQMHYTRVKAHGDPHHRYPKTECSIDGCARDARSRGWCSLHLDRWRRHGDPLFSARRRATADMTPEDRFWVQVDVGLCWEWTGAQDQGYGLFSFEGRPVRAHRWLWELLVELIPAGLQLDHLCRNHSCVNPDHLEPVTQAENIRRGNAALWW